MRCAATPHPNDLPKHADGDGPQIVRIRDEQKNPQRPRSPQEDPRNAPRILDLPRANPKQDMAQNDGVDEEQPSDLQDVQCRIAPRNQSQLRRGPIETPADVTRKFWNFNSNRIGRWMDNNSTKVDLYNSTFAGYRLLSYTYYYNT